MTMTKSESRIIFEERVKYLVSTDYLKLKEEDKINKILIKICLDPFEYNLINEWCKWNTDKLSSKRNIENQISKIITKLKPVVFTNANNPFIKEKNTKKNKSVCFADKVIELFLKEDIILIPKAEYIKFLELTI